MHTDGERVTRHARWTVGAGAVGFVAWAWTVALGAPPAVTLPLGLYGFVLHTVFGKGYALLPAYFDRSLAWSAAPGVTLALAAPGSLFLALGGSDPGLGSLAQAGATAVFLGTAVFVGTLAWTVRGNPTGRETGTADHRAELARTDRLANAAVPVVVLYLLGGTGLAAARGGLSPAAGHLVGAGAFLLVLAVGTRLLPRLYGATPPRSVVVALAAGAVGPALLAWAVVRVAAVPRPPLALAWAVETVALVGYGGLVWGVLRRADRRPVGWQAVGAGAVAGVGVLLLGARFAFLGPTGELVALHRRLVVGGLLGLTIVGVGDRFYPPGLAFDRIDGERVSLAATACLVSGLLVQVAGALAAPTWVVTVGEVVTALGAAAVAVLRLQVFRRRG